jgi:arsenate reductase
MTEPLRIYHNPRCSKSRAACAILAGKAISVEVVEYLKTPPTRDELVALIAKLGLPPGDIVRTNETIFKNEYHGRVMSDDDWIDAMVDHPILIERPILVAGDRAVVARPPERVLELL